MFFFKIPAVLNFEIGVLDMKMSPVHCEIWGFYNTYNACHYW